MPSKVRFIETEHNLSYFIDKYEHTPIDRMTLASIEADIKEVQDQQKRCGQDGYMTQEEAYLFRLRRYVKNKLEGYDWSLTQEDRGWVPK